MSGLVYKLIVDEDDNIEIVDYVSQKHLVSWDADTIVGNEIFEAIMEAEESNG
jgi:heat shock protein HspQ